MVRGNGATMSQPSEAFRPLAEAAIAEKHPAVGLAVASALIDTLEEVSLRRDVRIMYRLVEEMQAAGAYFTDAEMDTMIRRSGLGDPAAGTFDDSQDMALHRLVVTQFGGDAHRLLDYLNNQLAPAKVVPIQRQSQSIPPPSQRPDVNLLGEVIYQLQSAARNLVNAADVLRKTL
jgi:hypothetical protein